MNINNINDETLQQELNSIKENIAKKYMNLQQIRALKQIKSSPQITHKVLQRLIPALELSDQLWYKKEDIKLLIKKLQSKELVVTWNKDLIYERKDGVNLLVKPEK